MSLGPNCGILVWSCLTVRLLRDIIFYSLLISSEGLTARMNQLELAQFIASLNHTDLHMLRYRTHDRAFNVVAALRICQEHSLEQFRNQSLITQRAFAKVITHNGEYLLALFEWLGLNILQHDKRYIMFNHTPEVRRKWIQDYLVNMAAPKLSVHVGQ